MEPITFVPGEGFPFGLKDKGYSVGQYIPAPLNEQPFINTRSAVANALYWSQSRGVGGTGASLPSDSLLIRNPMMKMKWSQTRGEQRIALMAQMVAADLGGGGPAVPSDNMNSLGAEGVPMADPPQNEFV